MPSPAVAPPGSRIVRLAGSALLAALLTSTADASTQPVTQGYARVISRDSENVLGSQDIVPVAPILPVQFGLTADITLHRDFGEGYGRAGFGIDFPNGSLTGRISSYADVWDYGYIRTEETVSIILNDVIQVRSLELPVGTPVEFELHSRLFLDTRRMSGDTSAAGASFRRGTICVKDFWWQYDVTCSTEHHLALLMGMHSTDDAPRTISARVGDDIPYRVELLFLQGSSAVGSWDWANHHFSRGYADLDASVALIFAVEGGQPPPAAMRGLFPTAAASGVGGFQLYSGAYGSLMPGLEAFEDANVLWQLRPLAVPAPSAGLLMLTALSAVAWRRSKPR